MLKIGYIGLGLMGKSIARNILKAGYPLVVHNRRRAAVDESVAEGATAAFSPAITTCPGELKFAAATTPAGAASWHAALTTSADKPSKAATNPVPGGTASDIRIQAEQSLHIKRTMAALIAKHTGQTVEQIEADSDRDRWFTAEQALEYGFIDHVYERASQIATEAPNQ